MAALAGPGGLSPVSLLHGPGLCPHPEPEAVPSAALLVEPFYDGFGPVPEYPVPPGGGLWKPQHFPAAVSDGSSHQRGGAVPAGPEAGRPAAGRRRIDPDFLRASPIPAALHPEFQRGRSHRSGPEPGGKRVRLRVHRLGAGHVLPPGPPGGPGGSVSDFLYLPVQRRGAVRRFPCSVDDGPGPAADAPVQRGEGPGLEMVLLPVLPRPYLPAFPAGPRPRVK